MADRIVRWVCVGLLLGLAPLALAYGARWYYAERPPTMPELLGAGDALLVVVAWCANALLDLLTTRRRGPWALLLGAANVLTLAGAAVAYGCLTADSVIGRVQTSGQAAMLTETSLWGLTTAAALSTVAAAWSAPRKEAAR